MNTFFDRLAIVLVAILQVVGLSILGGTIIITLLSLVAPKFFALSFFHATLLSFTAILVAHWIRCGSGLFKDACAPHITERK